FGPRGTRAGAAASGCGKSDFNLNSRRHMLDGDLNYGLLERQMSTTLLAMSSALPGREKDYAEWYLKRHLKDMLRVPGVVSGTFYGRAGPQSQTRWAHCAFYELDRPINEVFAEIGRRVGGPEMPLTDATDRQRVAFMEPAFLRPRLKFAEASGPTLLNLLMAKPYEGREDAFEAWADVLLRSVPGCFAAQQRRLSPQVGASPSPWRDLLMHELPVVGASEAIEAGLAAARTQEELSGVDHGSLYSELFRQLS
ncbi:MAG TPA: hypothetical protein VJQ45_10085, partial [Ktedonobacterales bacterium]|nr:hypothetical protein [Ktedonobacterales bacterium]